MIKTVYTHAVIVLAALVVFTGCNSAATVVKLSETSQQHEKTSYIAQGENTGRYWPTNGWKTCSPEAVGMDSQKLARAMEYAATPEFNTQGILVVKNGYIVSEAYFPENNYGHFDKNTEHNSYSMAKSVTSALVGIAIDKGILSGVDEKICQYYEDWDCNDSSDLRSKITIRHALTLTTGLEWQEDWSKWDFETNDTLKMVVDGHFYRYMSRKTGLYEPGTKAIYSTGDPMLLSKVFQEACGMTAFEFARQNLFVPLNISDIRWAEDEDGYTATHGELFASARSFAKFGYLFLNKGKWEDQQIVSGQWVEQSTKTDPTVNMWKYYSYLWHVNLPERLAPANLADNLIQKKGSVQHVKGIPSDAYMAAGVLGQYIVIFPSNDLIIVRLAYEQKDKMGLANFIKMVINSEK